MNNDLSFFFVASGNQLKIVLWASTHLCKLQLHKIKMWRLTKNKCNIYVKYDFQMEKGTLMKPRNRRGKKQQKKVLTNRTELCQVGLKQNLIATDRSQPSQFLSQKRTLTQHQPFTFTSFWHKNGYFCDCFIFLSATEHQYQVQLM